MDAVDLAKVRKYLPYIAIIGSIMLSIITVFLAVSFLATGADEGKLDLTQVSFIFESTAL